MTIDLKALVGADSISQSTSVALPHLAVIEVTGKDAEKLDITKEVISALNKKVSSVKMEKPQGF